MSELTKRALEQSLKNLLLQKPLNKITISDIADDCGINRMTFYYHFKDIYDLVEWSCQEDAAKALAGKKTYETWQQGFEQIFEAVLANKPFIMNVYHSVSREQVENYLYQLTYDLLEGVVEEQAAGMSVRPEDKAFIAHEMERGCKASGVKRIRIHDIRHSHVSLLIEMGFSALAIAERMGHEAVDITYRYAHLFPTKQDEMAAALERFRLDAPSDPPV